MEPHGLERVFVRNQFYWESYRYLAIALVLLLTLILALGGFLFYQRMTWPTPRYFPTTPDGRPIPIVPLNEPLYENPLVLEWAVDTLKKVYSLDFVTWRKSLQNAAVYFTPSGYQDFLMALKASTNLAALKANHQVVSVEVVSPPLVMKQGQASAVVPYSWTLQIGARVTYQNALNEIIKQEGILLMVVERASLLRYKEGLAIEQLVFQAN